MPRRSRNNPSTKLWTMRMPAEMLKELHTRAEAYCLFTQTFMKYIIQMGLRVERTEGLLINAEDKDEEEAILRYRREAELDAIRAAGGLPPRPRPPRGRPRPDPPANGEPPPAPRVRVQPEEPTLPPPPKRKRGRPKKPRPEEATNGLAAAPAVIEIPTPAPAADPDAEIRALLESIDRVETPSPGAVVPSETAVPRK